MSLRSGSEQLAGFRRHAQPLIERTRGQEDQLSGHGGVSMHRVGTDEPHSAVTFLALEDEDSSSRSAVRLLITASTQRGDEALARRIHGAGLRAELPFVHVGVRPSHRRGGAEGNRSGFLDAAAGGCMLIGDVEEMPRIVQDLSLESLDGLEFARHPSAAVRRISGTSVSLLDRVTAGTFPDRLLYRLNVIHVRQGDRPNLWPTPIRPR